MVATTGVVAVAWAMYPNIYASTLALSNSLVTVVVLMNMAVSVLVILGLSLIRIFLGRLREHEIESVTYRGWVLVVSTLMLWNGGALSNRGDPFDLGVCALLFALLFALHWVCDDRVQIAFNDFENLKMQAVVRLGALVLINFAADCWIVRGFVRGETRTLVFAPFVVEIFELGLATSLRYATNFREALYLRNADDDEDEWELKPTIVFCVNTFVDSLGLLAHSFVVVGLRLYTSQGILNCFVRARRLVLGYRDFMRTKKTQSEMDSLVTLASIEDVARDSICVICREVMEAGEQSNPRRTPKKLSCGHVLHGGCLKSWLSRSHQCPTCRQPVSESKSAFARFPAQAQAQAQGQGQGEAQLQANEIPRAAALNVEHDDSAGPAIDSDNQNSAEQRQVATFIDVPIEQAGDSRVLRFGTGRYIFNVD